jgi:hypothetical protein
MISVARSSQARLAEGCWFVSSMIKPSSCRWNKRLFERFGGDHHLVSVVAVGALEDPEVETYAYGHDASEHHVSVTLGAGGALDLNLI